MSEEVELIPIMTIGQRNNPLWMDDTDSLKRQAIPTDNEKLEEFCEILMKFGVSCLNTEKPK